jgi:hypothetical protein
MGLSCLRKIKPITSFQPGPVQTILSKIKLHLLFIFFSLNMAKALLN